MSRLLYELCGKDQGNRFSPYVWRTRLALCQKNLEFEGVPGSFLDKESFAESGSKLVPVLKDGDRWVSDSWTIANYLEETYSDAPLLFGGAEGKAYGLFMRAFIDGAILPRMFVLVAPDIAECCEGEHKDYFVKTRSERVGMPIADLVGLRDKNLPIYKTVLTPLKNALAEQPFYAGQAPLYPDFVAYSAFRWAKQVSPLDLLEGEDELSAWYGRVDSWYREKIVGLEKDPLL